MLGRKKKQSLGSSKIMTLLAGDIHLMGDLEFSDGIRLDGKLTGHAISKPGSHSLFVVSKNGVVHGDIHGYDVIINGTVLGNVSSEHFLELQGNARVTGNIDYRQLQMDYGARVDGTLTRTDEPGAAQAGAEDEVMGPHKPVTADSPEPGRL
jgi:cytoskeletal protein CcmA (bactofilin family)